MVRVSELQRKGHQKSLHERRQIFRVIIWRKSLAEKVGEQAECMFCPNRPEDWGPKTFWVVLMLHNQAFPAVSLLLPTEAVQRPQLGHPSTVIGGVTRSTIMPFEATCETYNEVYDTCHKTKTQAVYCACELSEVWALGWLVETCRDWRDHQWRVTTCECSHGHILNSLAESPVVKWLPASYHRDST